ncbi:hypothetical protein HDV03_004238 [Kappamyces sp. JEL0829]|nr:hypothetical protein HDV03_004238 [Kappamyces sp. JEL0829]KAJ3368944.1 hypothetical protein HDU91_000205 [Kappamyces sp. JEL0680]
MSPPQTNQTLSAHQLLEKESLRKSTHSAIEKKRREKMAAILDNLKNLTPTSRGQVSIQKLQILENAVSYIRQLQDEIIQKAGREQGLQIIAPLPNFQFTATHQGAATSPAARSPPMSPSSPQSTTYSQMSLEAYDQDRSQLDSFQSMSSTSTTSRMSINNLLS